MDTGICQRKASLQQKEQEINAKPKDSREVEFEVELPGVNAGRVFPLLICESQAQLDDFQQVNVTAKELVLIIYGAAEFTDRPDDDSGELRVLAEKGKLSFTMDSVSSHYYHSARAAQTVKTFTASEEQTMPTLTKTALSQIHLNNSSHLSDKNHLLGEKPLTQPVTVCSLC